MKRPRPALALLWTLTALLMSFGAWSAVRADPASAEVGAAVTGSVVAAPASQVAANVSVPRGSLGTPLVDRLRSLLGLMALTALAWGLSVDRTRRIPWRVVGWGLGLQLLFALFILKTPVGAQVFDTANTVVVALLGFTVDGARFVFGNLVDNNIPLGSGDPGNGPFVAASGQVANTGSYFAFTVLPTIIFFSSLMTVLYHLGIMQKAVKGVAWVMQRTMGTSGAETLSAAGNIFVGQTEAPLLIKPFVERMTTSELMAVMTAGFATVAGGVMAAYVGMLLLYFPDIAGHLMAASVMSAPAALVVAKLMVPETETPVTANSLEVSVDRPDVNVIDAAARGASEGLYLALNVGAMLLAFVALIYLFNGFVGWVGGLAGFQGLTLEMILGWLLAPLAWLMGVSWADAPTVASLLGIKTVLNEFFAYIQLAGILGGENSLEPRSVVIVTYALCGFANFSSIAIQLGGIGGIAPSRRHDLSRLGLRAMIGGTIAAFMTATVAGMIL
ncbi:MAG TPA: nucleoside transporter C-terminal domain-containing protein [Longimicrobiales bacterium]|nr:nucleoside transporter C-terminal domain-containing protein [Longimicrobiales bacterium]